MPETLVHFAERLFVGPVWPASVMVGVMLVYAAIVSLGWLDLGVDSGPDLDVDAGIDADLSPDVEAGLDADLPADGIEADADGVFGSASSGGSISSLGAMTFRWLNLSKIPVIIWLSVFTSFFWAISYAMWYGYDGFHYTPTLLITTLLTIRNVVFATLVTKLITNHLGFLSKRAPTFEAARLIGKTCRVSTREVSPSFGQAEFQTDAAPLLLNIRIDSGVLPRGTLVEITGFDPETRTYTVVASLPSSTSP